MREEMDETKAPEERENGDLTLKMESLLVHGNGESAVVLVIDSNHSSLQNKNAAKAIQTEGHVIRSLSLSLRSSASLPSTCKKRERKGNGRERMGGVRELKRKRGRGEQAGKGGK